MSEGEREAIARIICCGPAGCRFEGDSEDGSKCYCDTSDFYGSGIEKKTDAILAARPASNEVRVSAWKDGRLEPCGMTEFIQSLRRYSGWADQEFGVRSDPAAHLGERLNAAADALAALAAEPGESK